MVFLGSDELISVRYSLWISRAVANVSHALLPQLLSQRGINL
jgi:hypothetical protein